MYNELTKELFDEHINTTFMVGKAGSEKVSLTLFKTKEKKRPGTESLSLFFKGPVDNILNDDTYQFEHKEMETVDLFISPYEQSLKNVMYDVHIVRRVDDEN